VWLTKKELLGSKLVGSELGEHQKMWDSTYFCNCWV